MERYNRLISHYPMVDLGLVISLVLAFCAIVGCVSIESNIINAEADSKNYSLEYDCDMTVSNVEFGQLISGLKNVGDIAKIDDAELMCNAAVTTCLVDIFVHGDVEVWYPLVEGDYPYDEISAGVPAALVGESEKDMLYERDGKQYIMVESEEYLVTGIIGTSKSNLLAYTILLFSDDLGDNVTSRLEGETGFTVHAESASENTQMLYSKTWSSLKETSDSVSIQVLESHVDNYEKNKRSQEVPSLLLFLFCLIEAVLVSELWVYQRMPELVIRKTYGYTNRQVALYLASEILRYLLLTAVLVYAGLAVLCYLEILSMRLSLLFAAMLLCMALFIGMIVICYPLYYINHMSEWQLLKDVR